MCNAQSCLVLRKRSFRIIFEGNKSVVIRVFDLEIVNVYIVADYSIHQTFLLMCVIFALDLYNQKHYNIRGKFIHKNN